MARKRNPENAGLPKRWKLQHGAYYYQVPPGFEAKWDGKKLFRLGQTLPEAYREWAARLDDKGDIRTVNELLDRYEREVVPTKAPATQTGNRRQIRMLRPVFGHMGLLDPKPKHVYGYFDKRASKTNARLEIAVLSHAYTKAVEWGKIDAHPFKGQVELSHPEPRDRYIEDWEIVEALALPCKRKRGSILAIQAYIRLKLLTALRKTDLLQLPVAAGKPDGIHLTTSKGDKPIIIVWTPALRCAWDDAILARPIDIGPLLFCNKHGESYLDPATGETSGFDSMWQRFMARLLKETKAKDKTEDGQATVKRFTEHDLRAKAGSDAESAKRAQELLTHADERITRRVYRRKPERIQPAR